MQRAKLVKLFLASAVLGALIGFVSTLFIKLVHACSHFIWSDVLPGSQHKPLTVIAVSVAAGLLMGLCVKYFGSNDEGIGFDAVLNASKKDGELGFKQVKRVVFNAFPGLVSGASIGPEAPLITLGGFCGDALAKILKSSKEQLMAFIAIALGGSMGVLLDSPAAGPLLFAESPPTKDDNLNRVLVFTSMLAASIGFAIYFALGNPLIAGDKIVPTYTGLKAVHLLYGLLIGFIGTLIGLAFKSLVLYCRQLAKKLSAWPVARGALVGAIVGLLSSISPLVMFDGSSQLSHVVLNLSKYSILALLGLALVRLVSTSVALGGGYQAGNIFPSIFIAGAVGLAISSLIPAIPAPVAMVSCMASVMYVFTPMPLFCIFLFTELSSFSLVPVMAMSLISAYILKRN